jgi:hypothetical protein
MWTYIIIKGQTTKKKTSGTLQKILGLIFNMKLINSKLHKNP